MRRATTITKPFESCLAALQLRAVIAAAVLYWAVAVTGSIQAQGLPANHEKLRQETQVGVSRRLAPLLKQYCQEACSIIEINVQVEELISETDDLGFEGVLEDGGPKLYVDKVQVDIQVDDRVSARDRDHLLTILRNKLQNVANTVDFVWKPVTMPQIGQAAAKEEELKRSMRQRLSDVVEALIAQYCPHQCVLSQVAVDGKLVTPDEAQGIAAEGLVRDRNGQGVLKLEAVDVEVSMDETLTPESRTRIANMIKAKTRFATPLNLDVQVSAFPESYVSKKEREEQLGKDPYGLEKLRKTLELFRDLAGTKEVITTNSSNIRTPEHVPLDRSGEQGIGGAPLWQWAAYGAGLLLMLGMIVGLLLRFVGASRDARMMMQAADYGASFNLRRPQAAGEVAHDVGGGIKANSAMTADERRTMGLRLKNQELRDELVQIFLDQPRVAKETFSRLLQEEGIEHTARYVHIFGHLVIFELLGDPNLQRDLYELSEYYHKTEFDFTPDEEHKHLSSLRTRVTANEIRVLTRRQMDRFDFLLKLDATQIFNLVADEKPQVQSIVLTQLDHKRRRSVFDMYQGEARVSLMRELCRADAIPKEYLANVAKALHKKVTSRPEFDTENLRSSDILLDLLEKAELSEQRGLMTNLMATNPEAARGIKLRLVTVEVMPYLKDGHLLEIILGLERDDLLAFLGGARDHIRGLIISKAPEELAESWIEELAHKEAFDEQSYRLVEMKILGRIRALANNGVINLIDVNDMIFGQQAGDGGAANDADEGDLAFKNDLVA